ncbi:MAG: hypothetical protein L3J46_09855, partial [Kangiellaceae bacterium]|nr:hypothetical protein [Kangiellaceae bacterium]
MEIKPSEISRSQEQPPALDPKIAKLLNSIANRPLLLEKLLASQSHGLVVQLTSQTNPTKNLILHLPLNLSRAFESANQLPTEVSIVVTANQRVIISISQSISSTAPTAATLPKLETPQSILTSKTSQQEIIQFRFAQLLPDQIIKLLDPMPPTSNQLKLFGSTAGAAIPYDIATEKTALTINNVTTNKPEETSLATIASRLLGHNFSKRNPVASHLTQIKQIIAQLKNNDFQSPSI